MPNKRNPLPRDCPKCGFRYGTVQMVFFSGKRKNGKANGGTHQRVIRIGHYDSAGYFEAKKENASVFNDDSEEDKDRKLRSSQRRWCSFRSEVLDDFMWLSFNRPEKPITKPISAEVWNKVVEVGWRAYSKN